jgi:cytidylate kinase/RimJ/RimL family protein N-acetyltransferase
MSGPVVTISRQHGSGGEEVAALVAERLGVPVLDHEIRQRASERAGVSERVFEEAERPVSWVTRILERLGSVGVMADGGAVETAHTVPIPTSETFRAVMDEVVREAAEEGAVIVGHGAHLALRDQPGVVRVFVQAPIEARVQRLVHQSGISAQEARRQAETWDRERVRFYRDAYHVDWFDARLYDCVVDTHLLGIHGAAEIILDVAQRVGIPRPEPVPAEAPPAPRAAAGPSREAAEGEVVKLKDAEVRLRPMTSGDAPALLALFRSLPPEDLLFLRRNVTDPRIIEAWEREVVDGRMFTLLAETRPRDDEPARIVGEASLRPSDVPWTSHVGEVRAVTAPDWRGRGLGTLLLREILRSAHDAGITKVTAETMAEQKHTRELLRRLGFVEEGHYAGYARDLAGEPHDLIVMTHTEPVTEAAVTH